METMGRKAYKWFGAFFVGFGFWVFFFSDCSNILAVQQTKKLYYHCPYGTCFRTQMNSLNNCHNHYELKHENLKTISSIIISFTKYNKQRVEQKHISSEFQILPRAA